MRNFGNLLYPFLGATKHLYKRVCPSVRRCVGWSIGWSVTPSHYRRFWRALEHRVASIGSCWQYRSTAWPVFGSCYSVTPYRLRMLPCLIHPITILEVPITNSPFNHRPLFSLQFMVSTQASGVGSVYPPAKTNQNIIRRDAKERIHEASRRILINIIAATC